MKQKVALVTDIMTFPGGAERLMMSFLKLYPDARIFTTVFLPQNYWEIKNNIQCAYRIDPFIRTLYKVPFFAKILSSIYTVLSPIAFEKLDLQQFDIVVTFTARAAKGVITAPYAKHINYILTPTRYEWDNDLSSRTFRKKGLNKLISPFLANFYRLWDFTAVRRADKNIAISKFISNKIKKSYRIGASVVYPGINEKFATLIDESEKLLAIKELENFDIEEVLNEKFYLVVSRLYDYKKTDLAVKACMECKKNLIIVGDGPDKKYLQKLAKKSKSNNIIFLGRRSDDCVKYLYSKAEALLFCGIEDFGLVPVEAMAQGCPIISYNIGGGAETILPSKTGELFNLYEELVDIVAGFDKNRYNKAQIIQRAKEFSEERFLENIKREIESIKN